MVTLSASEQETVLIALNMYLRYMNQRAHEQGTTSLRSPTWHQANELIDRIRRDRDPLYSGR